MSDAHAQPLRPADAESFDHSVRSLAEASPEDPIGPEAMAATDRDWTAPGPELGSRRRARSAPSPPRSPSQEPAPRVPATALRAVFYSEFDNTLGRVIKHQAPAGAISPQAFDAVAEFVLPAKEFCGRLISIADAVPPRAGTQAWRILCFPMYIEDNKYDRNALFFSLGLALADPPGMGPAASTLSADLRRRGSGLVRVASSMLSMSDGGFPAGVPGSKLSRAYAPIEGIGRFLERLAVAVRSLEAESGFLSRRRDRMALLLPFIYERLSQPMGDHAAGLWAPEPDIIMPLDEDNTLWFRFGPDEDCAVQALQEARRFREHDVPVLLVPPAHLRARAHSPDGAVLRILPYLDLTVIRILPYLDGRNYAGLVAELAEVDLGAVLHCCQMLQFHGLATAVNVFQRTNAYAPGNAYTRRQQERLAQLHQMRRLVQALRAELEQAANGLDYHVDDEQTPPSPASRRPGGRNRSREPVRRRFARAREAARRLASDLEFYASFAQPCTVEEAGRRRGRHPLAPTDAEATSERLLVQHGLLDGTFVAVIRYPILIVKGYASAAATGLQDWDEDEALIRAELRRAMDGKRSTDALCVQFLEPWEDLERRALAGGGCRIAYVSKTAS